MAKCAHVRVCAQVRCNRGAWGRVRASILGRAQVRTAGRAHACVYVGLTKIVF